MGMDNFIKHCYCHEKTNEQYTDKGNFLKIEIIFQLFQLKRATHFKRNGSNLAPLRK
jgi:hypothetical protein